MTPRPPQLPESAAYHLAMAAWMTERGYPELARSHLIAVRDLERKPRPSREG